MNILMLGDIYAKPGRDAIAKNLKQIIKENHIDFVIANGENISHGKGIKYEHYKFLKDMSIDVVTSGNHIFKQSTTLEFIDDVNDLLKPANMSSYTPGPGFVIVEKNNKKICVLNLLGQTFMEPCNNPYEIMDAFLEFALDYDILMVDFHAEASAEKIAFALYYDGIITGFAGTHTHVQTADERILPKGTGFITDLGMTGVINSVIGANPKEVIFKERTQLPARFKPAEGATQLCGSIFEINELTNKVSMIKRIFLK
ncbi:metallophosphoesterase [Williamsoniiplasma somnilux]|uniref:Metallophosphoesterase n=1 Tax=Williamsoniiplasma somnilux TaxID=215578 RepID=A0A2K8NXV0_9MOLU|nr:TIGR00282 family metallophosphoesterase [Williamsoniiplasma somnilux]ATZ18617.1 metallophosphoesterase [Williamsoniiplasma somnilux]